MDTKTIVEQFTKDHVLVIGEAMLDCYLKGTADRLSPEAAVPVVNIQDIEYAGGGAANTAVNLARLGAKASLLSVIGNDDEGSIVTDTLRVHDVEIANIIKDHKRKTMAKKRIVAGTQLIVRYDTGSTEPLSDEQEQQLTETLVDIWDDFDAVIVSDYGYGILTEHVRNIIKKLQKIMPKILVVDAKQLDRYKDMPATAVKPNFSQAVSLLGITKPAPKGQRADQILTYKQEFLDRTNAEIITVTIDAEGTLVFDRRDGTYRTYAKPVPDSQTSGAGDTYVSALTLALTAGADTQSAAEIAAAAAQVAVNKPGTTFCTLSELLEQLSAHTKYISGRERLHELVEEYRKAGKRIVFTNGCFDILHSGHVSYLNRAKMLGDILIVGLNTDESIKRLKGPSRPVNPLEDRAQVLAGLSSVDHIVSFAEDTPIELIKTIKPDIHVKGGDYRVEEMPETPIVQAYGGKIEILPYVKDYSTTRIINRIHKNTHESDTANL